MEVQKKVLFCATVDIHFKVFHLPYLKWFKDQGWEVHVATSGDMDLPFVDEKHTICIQRSPFKWKNLHAYTQLKYLMKKNKYKLVHCHTPMGGMLARLAAREARKQGTKVIYTAHGFHFCKGAPLLNWLVYYPIERWMARYTDCLITINQEDYKLAVERRFAAKRIEHVHGVGVPSERFKPVTDDLKKEWRRQLGYQADQFLLFYAAEFNKNKNQQLLIQAFALIKDEIPHARLLLAGEGPLLLQCREQATNLGVGEKVCFLGYRNDIEWLLPICDVAVASSLREGLPVNILEAMSCGLPILASDNRGHRELVHNNVNGWIVSPNDTRGMAEKMKRLAFDQGLKERLGSSGRKIIESRYNIHKILEEKSAVYTHYMDRDTDEKEGLRWATR
jgi:glycosyltransferase EpsD